MTAVQIAVCSLVVASCSFSVSAFLGYLKYREYRRDNGQIHVNYHLEGQPGTGDRIFLTNLSATPILVDYWQVGWVKWRWWRRVFDPIDLFADEDLHLTLTPRVRKILTFKDE